MAFGLFQRIEAPASRPSAGFPCAPKNVECLGPSRPRFRYATAEGTPPSTVLAPEPFGVISQHLEGFQQRKRKRESRGISKCSKRTVPDALPPKTSENSATDGKTTGWRGSFGKAVHPISRMPSRVKLTAPADRFWKSFQVMIHARSIRTREVSEVHNEPSGHSKRTPCVRKNDMLDEGMIEGVMEVESRFNLRADIPAYTVKEDNAFELDPRSVDSAATRLCSSKADIASTLIRFRAGSNSRHSDSGGEILASR
ncbi:hypothetical protein DFH06DRAFT_1133581 [Mycena polygramma]|nr:hypothetical protein DFH06DRAFT_1133581 [Mycena polygramma]